MKIAVQLVWIMDSGHDVFCLCLQLLQADDAGGMGCQPIQYPFVDGRPNAVQVQRDYSKHMMNSDFRRDFIQFALAARVLCFGEFKTKAGRLSPYFFNTGLFNDGASLRKLG